MILLIKLLLAHIIGDFFLQPEKWVKEKEKKKLKSEKLYFHVLIHIVITTLLLWNLKLWPIIIIIGFSHFIIDATKLIIQKKKTKRFLFFIDQLLHVLIIVGCYFYFSKEASISTLTLTKNGVLLLHAYYF
jgi:hypothetical protein